MAKLRAIGYTRVSTSEQVEGFGLGVQAAAIQEHCGRHSVRLVGIESDEGQSGSNGLEHRRGLARALAILEAGEADQLVVYRLDRLARDVVISETVIRRLQATGRQVVSIAEPEGDGDEHTRRLVRVMLSAIAEYEAAVIRGRMMAGKAAKVASGGYGGGKPRYGTRAKGRELVTDEAEAAVVRRIRELRAVVPPMSYRDICKALTTEGYRTRRGGPWQPAVVRRIATRT